VSVRGRRQEPRANRAADPRGRIDEVKATPESLMPKGLEMQLTKQDVADVIAYLQAVGKGK
jgi:hypothetical protein